MEIISYEDPIMGQVVFEQNTEGMKGAGANDD
jgi:hypothetical protein